MEDDQHRQLAVRGEEYGCLSISGTIIWNQFLPFPPTKLTLGLGKSPQFGVTSAPPYVRRRLSSRPLLLGGDATNKQKELRARAQAQAHTTVAVASGKAHTKTVTH